MTATRAQALEILNYVYQLLINRHTHKEIIQLTRDRYPHLSPRSVRAYITKANRIISEEAKIDRETELGKTLNRLHKLVSMCEKECQEKGITPEMVRTILAIEKEIAELKGLKEIKPFISTGTMIVYEMTPLFQNKNNNIIENGNDNAIEDGKDNEKDILE